jgi:co-chaperonin GroES (HSP10)
LDGFGTVDVLTLFSRDEKPQKGKVLAVGDGRLSEETDTRTPLDALVPVGDSWRLSLIDGAAAA